MELRCVYALQAQRDCAIANKWLESFFTFDAFEHTGIVKGVRYCRLCAWG